MKDRISRVIAHSGKTKTAFAKEINVSAAFVSQICSGAAKPSDRTIADICRIFGVNKEWLLNGTGDPFAPERDSEAEIIDRFMEDCENPLRKTIVAIMRAYMDSDPKDQEAIRKFAASFNKNSE